MGFENIIFEKAGNHQGLLIVNRPSSLNALNFKTLHEINHCLDSISDDIRFLVIKGSGEKSFIAGADIKEMNSLSIKEFREFLQLGQSITLKIEQGRFISIAAVNGYALGGGFEVALACDFLFASGNASFGFPEVRLGIIPGFGGNVRISRRIGLHKAKELVLSGKIINAETARDFGFVNYIIDPERLEQEVLSFIDNLSANSFQAMIAARNLQNKLFYTDITALLNSEFGKCSDCFETDDRKEGMSAFIEKRRPDF